MQIYSIKLKNFICHESLELDFKKKINIITGPNGSGKSAIREAILYALTGDIGRHPVKYGEKSCWVALVTPDFAVERQEYNSSTPTKLKVFVKGGEFDGNNTSKQQRLIEMLGTNEKVIRAVIDSGKFLQMKPDERKQIVFDVLDIEITEEKLIQWLNNKFEGKDWSGFIKKLKKEDKFFKLDQEQYIRKLATDMRRLIKRELNKLSAEIDRYLEVDPEAKNLLPKAEALLSQLESELKEALEQKGQKKVELMEELNKKIDKKTKEREELFKQRSEVAASLAKAESHIANHQDMIEKIKKLGKKCVLSDKIDCPMSGEDIQKLIEAEEFALQETQKMYDDIKKSMSKLDKKIKKAGQELNELMKQRGDLRWEDPELNKKIQELEFRIQRGKNYIQELKDKANAIERKKELEQQIAEKNEEVQLWDGLEKAYGEKGIKAEILRDVIKKMEEKANEVSDAAGIGKITFKTQENGKETFEILVNDKPHLQYSTAEQHVIALAVQHAISSLSNLRLLVLDNAELFVEPLNVKVSAAIFSIQGQYDTILIFRSQNKSFEDTEKFDTFHLEK
ncbi:MAG: AAA family ATPase [Calditrichaeota bacterium]|nr:AAA family ATPase [Calditrichota bacterium]